MVCGCSKDPLEYSWIFYVVHSYDLWCDHVNVVFFTMHVERSWNYRMIEEVRHATTLFGPLVSRALPRLVHRISMLFLCCYAQFDLHSSEKGNRLKIIMRWFEFELLIWIKTFGYFIAINWRRNGIRILSTNLNVNRAVRVQMVNETRSGMAYLNFKW